MKDKKSQTGTSQGENGDGERQDQGTMSRGWRRLPAAAGHQDEGAAGCLPSPAVRTPSRGCCQQGLSLPEPWQLIPELRLESCCWASMVPQFCGLSRVGPQALFSMSITVGRAGHLGPSGVFLVGAGSCLLVIAPTKVSHLILPRFLTPHPISPYHHHKAPAHTSLPQALPSCTL